MVLHKLSQLRCSAVMEFRVTAIPECQYMAPPRLASTPFDGDEVRLSHITVKLVAFNDHGLSGSQFRQMVFGFRTLILATL